LCSPPCQLNISATPRPEPDSRHQALRQKHGVAILFITDLDDLKRSVSRFREQINIRFPDHAIAVPVRLRGGDASPGGYHDALMSGTRGQHRFVQTFDDCQHEDCLAENYFGPSPATCRA
jgi:hypothetical protein